MHNTEEAVHKIMQMPKRNLTRKLMINMIRKEGNLNVLDDDKIRPVQRVFNTKTVAEEKLQFIPCPFCKGIYRKHTLTKHCKKCLFNVKSQKCNYVSLGQNVLLSRGSKKAFFDQLRLKTEVFPKMHADRASWIGKNDPVVCQYAENYLPKSKTLHKTSAVSNRIRELGRLLIVLGDIYNLKTMMEILNIKHYDKVVRAVQIIAGYNSTTKTFFASSLVPRFRNVLLATCRTVKTLILKQDPILHISNKEEALKTVKQFAIHVRERWDIDIKTLTSKDLDKKYDTKIQMLPITSDVIKLRKYAVGVADRSMSILKENPNDMSAFINLSEACLVLTILLNRKKVYDIESIRLKSYCHPNFDSSHQECLNAQSESEKILAAYFKHIITVGERDKSILIIFPKNVQMYIDSLLSIRKMNKLIPEKNPFLFGLCGSKTNWIKGSPALRKYARLSKVQNSHSLTFYRLRKPISTILQLINLTDTEKEQVAACMEHTNKTQDELNRYVS